MNNIKNDNVEEIKANVVTKPQTPDPKEAILKEAVKEVAKVDQTKEVVVLVPMLNIRKNANLSSEKAGLAKSGEKLTVSKTRVGEWWKVVKPVDGYVKAEFVADVKE